MIPRFLRFLHKTLIFVTPWVCVITGKQILSANITISKKSGISVFMGGNPTTTGSSPLFGSCYKRVFKIQGHKSGSYVVFPPLPSIPSFCFIIFNFPNFEGSFMDSEEVAFKTEINMVNLLSMK